MLALLAMVREFEEWGKVVNWDGSPAVDSSCKGIGVVVGEVGFEIFKSELIPRLVRDGNPEEIALMPCWKWCCNTWRSAYFMVIQICLLFINLSKYVKAEIRMGKSSRLLIGAITQSGQYHWKWETNGLLFRGFKHSQELCLQKPSSHLVLVANIMFTGISARAYSEN